MNRKITRKSDIGNRFRHKPFSKRFVFFEGR